MNITHDSVWKNNPTEKSVMVSSFVKYSYPILDKLKVKKAIDIACGNGLGVAIPLLQRGYDVHCFDHHASAIAALKHNAKNHGFVVKTKKADMFRKFPYGDAAFDASFCFQAIYHGRLEQIMFALSEIKRVTRRGGYFFATFMKYESLIYDKEKQSNYFCVNLPGKVLKSYLRQDKSQPHLFYFTSKNWEYNVPHYYCTKDELRLLLMQYFCEVKIRSVNKEDDRFAEFWFVSAKI